MIQSAPQPPFHRPPWDRAFVVLGLALAVGAGAPAIRAQAPPSVEYKIKAAYMLNFARYVEWPASAFSGPDAPLVIGVLGKDPFGHDLEATISRKTIERRSLRIERFADVRDLQPCHILFISSSERRRLPEVWQRLRQATTLTVGEMDQFAELGGMIQFVPRENTVRFEINPQAAERAGLKISSKLLQVSKGTAEPRDPS